jgi:hypothetical protein
VSERIVEEPITLRERRLESTEECVLFRRATCVSLLHTLSSPLSSPSPPNDLLLRRCQRAERAAVASCGELGSKGCGFNDAIFHWCRLNRR